MEHVNAQRSFRLLWIGQTLANLGDVLYVVAIISAVYAATGSAMMMALVPFVNTFARFWGGLSAPLLIDRFSLKGILVCSQLGKTLLFIGLWIGYEHLSVLFPLIAVLAFLDGWATPCRNALLPRLVAPDRLIKANSLVGVSDQIVQLGGWPLGGIVAAMVGGTALVPITLVLFVISTVMMMWITGGGERPSQSERPPYLESLKEGWVAIWQSPALKTVAVMDVIDSAANAVWVAAILYLYVQDVLHVSEAWWGYLNSAFFAGLLLGGAMTLRAEAALRPRLHLAIYGGAFLVGLFTLWFGLTTVPWLALVLCVLVGVGEQFKMIGQQTVLQLSAPPELLPKVFSARDATMTGVFGLASLGMGWLADQHGVQTVFVLAAALLLSSGMWAFVRRNHVRTRIG